MPSAIPIIEEKEEFYMEIHQSNKSIVDTNHAFLQTRKKKLAEIH